MLHPLHPNSTAPARKAAIPITLLPTRPLALLGFELPLVITVVDALGGGLLVLVLVLVPVVVVLLGVVLGTVPPDGAVPVGDMILSST